MGESMGLFFVQIVIWRFDFFMRNKPMEMILKILTLIMFIGILYNIRQRKKYDEWNEKKNQAIYDLG